MVFNDKGKSRDYEEVLQLSGEKSNQYKKAYGN